MSKRQGDFPPRLKRLGQHFLADPRILRAIVDALAPAGGDVVVEIGPGRGALTDLLVQSAARVVAVEIDRALAAVLSKHYAGVPNVRVVHADVLEMDLGELAGGSYLLAGNVPYYITTPIIFHALAGALPVRAVFLVQREVAERMVAEPGTGGYGALSVNVQALASVEIVARVPPGAFRPPPAVDSAVIRLHPLATPLVAASERERFRRFTQSLFGQRRKQLGTILRGRARGGGTDGIAVLRELAIDPELRPERLAPGDFVRLFRAIDERER